MAIGSRVGPLVLTGQVGEYRWEVHLAQAPVSYGLDPQTLYKGRGRIVRLVIYAPVGNTGVWRKVAAFHRGWLFGRKQYLAAVRQVAALVEG